MFHGVHEVGYIMVFPYKCQQYTVPVHNGIPPCVYNIYVQLLGLPIAR